jgi:N-acyl-D-aspartate/D-glutamate deacylase
MRYDLLVKNARIYDGSGMESYGGNIAVQGNRIVAVGEVGGDAHEVIDANGLAAAPGFVDVHTHYDAQIFWDPLLTSSPWHGVTTLVMGNCGLAFAPCKPEHREPLMHIFSRVEGLDFDTLEKGVPWTWTTFPEYLDAVERMNPALNLVALMGHSPIRLYVMGRDAVERPATHAEVEQMKDLVRQGMRAGAAGLSVSRSPVQVGDHGEPMPGKVAEDQELFEVCKTVGEFGRGFFEFNPRVLIYEKDKSERDRDFELLRAIAKETRLPTTWIGLIHQWDQPSLWAELMEKLDGAFREGLALYPQASCRPIMFRFSLKNIATIFDDMPNWRKVHFLSVEERIRCFRDPEVRKGLRYDLLEDPVPRAFSKRWDLMYVNDVKLEKNKPLKGKSITEIAAAQGKDVFATFMDLSLEENLDTQFITPLANGDEDAVSKIINYPHSLVSLSDGGAHVQFICDTAYPSYLLGHWVRENKAMSLEKAIKVLAAHPAATLGLRDRGMIRPGMAADLAIFDPDTVKPLEPQTVNDLPGNGPRLVQKCEGMHYTIVNGRVLTKGGDHSGAFPGQLLRGSGGM